ncbi:hypothetical protein ACU8V3_01545 [Cobetia marina]
MTILGFRLIPVPGAGWDSELIQTTASDIRELAERPAQQVDSWFGGRMGDRLLRLARHEQSRQQEQQSRQGGAEFTCDRGRAAGNASDVSGPDRHGYRPRNRLRATGAWRKHVQARAACLAELDSGAGGGFRAMQ